MTRVVIDVCRPKLLCTVRDMQRAELILLAVVALQVAGVQVLRCSAWGCSKKDESLMGYVSQAFTPALGKWSHQWRRTEGV